MKNQVLFLTFVAVVFTQVNAKLKTPRDLVDEIQNQLDDLTATVQGQVEVAHVNVRDEENNFIANSDNTITTGALAIQQEQDSLLAQINVIRALGESAGKDVSPCTDSNESAVRASAGDSRDYLRTCVLRINDEESRIVEGGLNIINRAYNTLRRLQNQINNCAGSLTCLSPLVTEIQLEKVRLPQNILTEVDAITSALAVLRTSVTACQDDNVANYVATGSAILSLVVSCANGILG